MGLKSGQTRQGLRNLSTGVSARPDSGVSRWEWEQDVTDSWGGNDGTNNGATFSTTSAVGSYSLSTDGADDNVDVSGITGDFSNGDPISISVWLRPDDLSGTTERPYDIGNVNDGDVAEGISVFFSAGDVGAQIADGSRHTIGTQSVSASTWYLSTITFDGSTATFYIDDASQVGTTDNTYTLPPTAVFGSGADGSGYYDGLSDDARVYNKSLTSTEVSNLYNQGFI